MIDPMNRHPPIARSIVCVVLLGLASTAPAATDEPAAICADRPSKASATCVVDPGVFQLETDLGNYTRLRLDGTTTETWLVTNPTIKLGIAKDVDVEANIAPWEVIRTRNPDGSTSTERGVGDLYLRAKWNFLPAGDGRLSASVLPYLKVPTARRGIGNRAVEGGVVVPVSYQLTDSLVVSTAPEFDALKDADSTGHNRHHLNTAQLVNVGYALPHDVTVSGELWGDWNVDPSGTVRQYSADIAAAWAVRKDLQVDVGLNFGLNRITPRLQAYFGIAQRF